VVQGRNPTGKDLVYCHSCGQLRTAGSVTCPHCGASSAERPAMAMATPTNEQASDTGAHSMEKYCFQCGAKIHRLAEICPKCGLRQPMLAGMPGAPVVGSTILTPMGGPSRLAAALFAILLGGIGIHKFYLGRVGWGIVYLIFCWTGIPMIVGIIEGIVYLTMSDEAFAAKYARK